MCDYCCGLVAGSWKSSAAFDQRPARGGKLGVDTTSAVAHITDGAAEMRCNNIRYPWRPCPVSDGTGKAVPCGLWVRETWPYRGRGSNCWAPATACRHQQTGQLVNSGCLRVHKVLKVPKCLYFCQQWYAENIVFFLDHLYGHLVSICCPSIN